MTENVLAWINAGWELRTGFISAFNVYATAIMNADGTLQPVVAFDGTVEGSQALLAILTPLPPLPLPPP